MDGGMTKWYKAAQKRYSVRRYKQEPSLEDMLALESAAAEGVHGTWRKRGEDMCFMPDVE